MRGRHSIGHGFDLLVMNIQGNLYIGSYIGTEGWIAVRKLVSNTQVKHLVCCKNSLVEDRRVDLKAICNCLTEMFYVRCKDFGYRYEKTSDDEGTAPGSTTEEEDRMPAKKTIRIITKTLRAKE